MRRARLRGLHRRDGDFEHGIVRLSGGQVLEHHARPAEDAHNHAVARVRQPLEHFIRNAGDDRQRQQAAQNAAEERQLFNAEQRKEHLIRHRADENRDEHDQKEERRAAARMQAGEPARVFRRQLQPGLVAVYGLMLRAVVHEHALDIRHEGNRDHIADQNRNARQSGGKVDDKAAVRPLADERRHARGQRDKQEQAQRDGKHHRDGHDDLVDARAQLLGEPLFKLAGLFLHHAEHLRALVEGFHAHFEHDHHVDAAADQRQPHPLVLFRERLVALARHHDSAVRTAHRDGDGFIRRALHHHAFHDGLPADILILMLLIAHCACSFPEALPQPRQGTEFPAPSKFSCGASLIRRPARRSAAFGAS